MIRRFVLWTLRASLLVLLVLVAAIAVQLRPDALRQRLTDALARRFNAEVAIDAFDVDVVPHLRLSGSGIRLRVRDRPGLPPFISIDHFWMDLQPFSIAQRHVNTVHIDGLKIHVPPPDARSTLRNGGPTADDLLNPSKVIIERLISHDAELSFVSTNPNRRPLLFAIRSLELSQLGFDRVIPFRAELTNPVPLGLVDASGTFGPWIKDDPAKTAVSGAYVFSNADLSTIDKIQGTLSSKGTFQGRLTAIDVAGTTSTPDFKLELGGKPLPLQTTFAATVNGTNGTTLLRRIDATLRRSTIVASGSVVTLPGPGHHSIDLNVSVPKGRLEDLLTLVSPNGQSPGTGDVALRASVHLPSGQAPTIRRLDLRGQFVLSRTAFKKGIQERIQEFSRRAQGKPTNDVDPDIVSDVSGAFVLTDGVMRLKDLAFAIPGATVALNGNCNLRDRTLDLRGTLTMQASVSKAVGGFRSIFLKVVDPFFRKAGKGTVLPIKIGGTMEAPKAGLNLRGR